ncbi:MAG: transcriptional regulator [Actinomycetia bacterium]|nr:transcriptional regulator [Actinomycetes bacterium]
MTTPKSHRDMYHAAVRYYLQDETMDSIARDFGVSRSSVSRMLKRARDAGFVQISVSSPDAGAELAEAIGAAFGVKAHVVAVPAGTGDTERLDRVSRVAAQLLGDVMESGHVLGVASGATAAHVAAHVARKPLTDCTVVQCGGDRNPYDAVAAGTGNALHKLAAAFGADVVAFPMPAFFDHAETKAALWRESAVRRVLSLRRRLDVALFGVAALEASPPRQAFAAASLDASQRRDLAGQGVVGGVCTVALREDGSWRNIALNARATGLTPADLASVPVRYCVVADPRCARAIVGALRAGTTTDLVVDDETARAVIARARLVLPSGGATDARVARHAGGAR